MQTSIQTSIQTCAQTSVNWLQAAITSAKLAAICAVALVATGCATPTGATFTKAEAAPDGQTQVYLYRKWAFQAGGENFSVQLDKQDMGVLFNGSYMRLTVAPGQHVLSVKPGVFSKTYETTTQLADQQTQFVEFAVPALVLTNPFMLGSDIAPRTPEQGVADMQGLKGVK